jgi:uncharacterized integral membrane protein (TIGR00698 family)
MTHRVLFILLLASSALPWISAQLALIGGVAFGLLVGNPWPKRSARAGKLLLQLSVVGLGFGLGIAQVWQAGRSGLVYTVVGIAIALLAGWLLGRWLKVRPGTASLITFGTAICGGSAIAAMAPVIEADDDEIAVALATVFTLNAVALFVFPDIGRWLGLDQRQFGLWAALAIHDTSSVVGAGAVYGTGALAVATTLKLARAAWIAPLTLAVGWARGSRGKATIPWFIVAFLGASCLRSLVPAGDEVWNTLYTVARRALVVTLFLIGSGLSRSVLREVGARSLAHGVLLWLFVAGLTLVAIRGGWVS